MGSPVCFFPWFFAEQAALDAGVKIVFAAGCGLDKHGEDPEGAAYRGGSGRTIVPQTIP